ncbi:hypothetical protein ACRS52_06475 [Bacillus cytotoxicus]|uniref:Phage protein n=1 Tax=Bacillus cytotoxicus TaxID=580165 RepID=A0AAX2CNM8_9BACI|nr:MULTISPECIES: hypothetical protein [Bacillus cereus group]SCM08005.1 Uncharacterized protein BCB44BAC_04512 [Bacillus cytotoxicus]
MIEKDALKYVVELGNVKTQDINGQIFSTQPLHVVEEPTARSFTVRSLSGLVDYVKSGFDVNEPLMIHVASPTLVTCFTAINGNYSRSTFVRTEALVPEFDFGHWYKVEKFIISLQSAFVKNDDRDVMLRVVGNITEENVKTYGDDGVSQSVVAKSGVATVAEVAVPNPVSLKPYRTFTEVDQPESDFVFRMQDGPSCSIHEADGGAWKLEAIGNIKKYLVENLSEEIESKKVFIIA